MEYAHPETLVDTRWVEEHLKDTEKVRLAEVDYDPKANYELGHVPNAVLFDWKKDINDPLYRSILSKNFNINFYFKI
jgi:thiosulfate/3-mercaptopyruvate sulfurtransferase